MLESLSVKLDHRFIAPLWHSAADGCVPLPLPLIARSAADGAPPLSAAALKLLPVLLSLSWSPILDGSEADGVVASAKRLRDLTGQGRHRGNDRLRAALVELAEIRFDLLDERRTSGVPVLAGYDLDRRTNRATWEVSPEVASVCANIAIWGPVDLRVVRALRSRHALRFYEIGTLYLNRDHRSWCMPLAEIRTIAGVAGQYPIFCELRRAVIDRAIVEINAHAPFTMAAEPVSNHGDRHVDAVRFTVTPKPGYKRPRRGKAAARRAA